MKFYNILVFVIVVSLIGMFPKLMKAQDVSAMLFLSYGLYLVLLLLVFYYLNVLLENTNKQWTAWLRYSLGLVLGMLLLFVLHLAVLQVYAELLLFFLNVSSNEVVTIAKVTAFRAFILQSIVYTFILFNNNRVEYAKLKEEISLLNTHLYEVRHHAVKVKEYKSTIVVRFQDKVIPVDVHDIAFFHVAAGVVFVWLTSAERYTLTTTLESIENELNPTHFYRANRQFIIHRNSIDKIELIENRKLKVVLLQLPPVDVVVSKEKSAAFLKWVESM
ncbi:MAG: LytTR family transcriptional regulator [Candidatus Kapabacteria bacterium]|nr:LytTR family transcriptional regulator [Candidatus Kapabacteria bacterium]